MSSYNKFNRQKCMNHTIRYICSIMYIHVALFIFLHKISLHPFRAPMEINQRVSHQDPK